MVKFTVGCIILVVFDKCTHCKHHHGQDTERYCPLVVNPSPYVQALAISTHLFSVLKILPFPEIHVIGLIQYMVF